MPYGGSAPSGSGSSSGAGPARTGPYGGSAPAASAAAPAPSDKGKPSLLSRILGGRSSLSDSDRQKLGGGGVGSVLAPQLNNNRGMGIIASPAEAVQAAIGFKSTSGSEDKGRLRNSLDALAGGSYGIRGDGVVNKVANFGLDVVTDPTVLLSGGTKAAQFGSRLLVEGGGEELAKIAATRGLSEAEQGLAKGIIREQIAKDGGGALAKRSLMDHVTNRFPGLSGEELAVDRATAGLVKEGRGGIRFAGKTVIPGTAFQGAGDLARSLPAAGVLDEAARTAFVPRAGVRKALGKDRADILYNAESRAAGELESHIGDATRTLRGESKLNKITKADREGPLLAAMENPALTVEPRLQGALDAMRAIRSESTASIVDHKLLPDEFLHASDEFVPRITTDAGFRAIAKAERKGALPAELAKAFKVDGSLNARSILPNATIPEAEAVRREMLAEVGVTLKKGETYYEHDPLKATVSHSAAVKRATGQIGVLETMAAVPGQTTVRLVDSPTVKAPNLTEDIAKTRSKIQTAKKNISRAEGTLSKEGPARPVAGTLKGQEPYILDPVERLKVTQRLNDHQAALKGHQDSLAALMEQKKAGGAANAAADAARKAPEGFEAIKVGERTAYVHPELAREINGVSRLVDSNASVQRFTRHVDEVQNFWRAQVTVMPIGTGFFARNFQGNILLNAVDNVGIRDYARSARIQRAVAKARKAGQEVESVLSTEDAKLFREAEKHNVYNAGAQEADLNHVFPGDQVGAFKGKTSALRLNGDGATLRNLPIIGTERGPITAGRDINAVIENNARLANFIANTRHSGSFVDAARRTRTTLFDYGDLTHFERTYARRLIPFYTFARKSTGVMLRELAHDPAKVNRIIGATKLAEDLSGRRIDSPYSAASRTLMTPIIPGQTRNTLGVGGYLGAAKQQILGTTIQDKNTGGFTTIDPNAPQSENRLERLANALLPEYGKYGRIQRTGQKLVGKDQDLLRVLLGLSPGDDPVARTPGGGQVTQSTGKKAPTAAKGSKPRSGGGYGGPPPR